MTFNLYAMKRTFFHMSFVNSFFIYVTGFKIFPVLVHASLIAQIILWPALAYLLFGALTMLFISLMCLFVPAFVVNVINSKKE